MGLFVEVSPKCLADQHISLATLKPMMIIGCCEATELILLRHDVRDATERRAHAVVRPTIDALQALYRSELCARFRVDTDIGLEVLCADSQKVIEPNRHRRWIHLCAFSLEPPVDVVVRVALHCLEVELSGDFHFRLHLKPVDLDRLETLEYLAKCLREVVCRDVPSDHAPFPAAAWAPSHLLAEKVYAVGH